MRLLSWFGVKSLILSLALIGCSSGMRVSNSSGSSPDLSFPEDLAAQLQSSGVQFKFASSSQNIAQNSCSAAVTVELVNSLGGANTFKGSVGVPLSASTSTMTFYSDSLCSTAVSMFTLTGTTASGQFYMKAGSAGAVTITADLLNLISASQSENIAAASQPSPAPTQITMGETNVLATGDNGNAGLLLAQSATLSQAGTIESLSFDVTQAAGQLYLGVYDATGPNGGPGKLLAQTNAFTPVVGWNTAPVVVPIQVPAGTYWLAYSPSSNNLAFVKAYSTTSSAVYTNATFGAMPASFAQSVSTDAAHWSFYATLNVSSSSSPAPSPMPAPTPAPAPISSTGDGSANAPAGTPQHAGLLNSYATRPSWKVAGVDYAVGPHSTPTKDPATIKMAGVSVDTSSRSIIVSADNITLDGYDFSLHGGYQIATSGSNLTVSNSNFAVGTNQGLYLIYVDQSASNLTVINNVFDGSSIGNDLSFIEYVGSGVVTLEYNWFKNYPGHIIELSQANGSPSFSVVYKYNVVEQGALHEDYHLNFLQFGGGTCTMADVEFNTTYQTPQISGGEGFQFYMNTQGGLIENAVMASNTMIANGGAIGSAMSYMVHPNAYNNDSSAPLGSVHDNFFDLQAAWGAFYDAPNGWTFSNNVDMRTKMIVNSNNSETIVAP